MIKKLLTGLAVFTAVTTFSQSGKSVKDIGIRANGVNLSSLNNAKVQNLNCDTVYNFSLTSPSTTLTLYTAATNTACLTGGYVTGNNCYGTSEVANYAAGAKYAAITNPSVTSCFVFFYKNPTSGNGTKGVGTHTVGLNIYNGAMATGPTPTAAPVVIGSTSAPMSSITSVFTATSAIGQYKFTFAAPVAVTAGGFFTSVVLPTTSGDTAVVWQQKSAATTSAWENMSGWGDMNVDWGGTINFELCVFPILGCSPLGIKEIELSNFFNLVPNPSNGVFSLVSTLSTINFDMTVTNAIGQQIINRKNISGGSVNEINLSEYNSGLYFVTLTSGNQSITKKIILNK